MVKDFSCPSSTIWSSLALYGVPTTKEISETKRACWWLCFWWSTLSPAGTPWSAPHWGMLYLSHSTQKKTLRIKVYHKSELQASSHQCCYMLCSQNWCFYYKCKLRPSCKGSGQLGPLLEGCYRTIPHATWSILLTTEAKEYTDMCLHWWDISLSRLLVYLYLSSHQLHKSSFTVIKSRRPCFTFSRLHYTIISALRIKSSYKI